MSDILLEDGSGVFLLEDMSGLIGQEARSSGRWDVVPRRSTQDWAGIERVE